MPQVNHFTGKKQMGSLGLRYNTNTEYAYN
jgi:hypothetical protein